MRGPSGHYLLSFGPYVVVGCVGTGYVLRVELPVQRRLCPIFVRDVGSTDIHECFRGLTSSQRTPGIWGVTLRNKKRRSTLQILLSDILRFFMIIKIDFC